MKSFSATYVFLLTLVHYLSFCHLATASINEPKVPVAPSPSRGLVPPTPFSVEGRLRDQVDFWIKIYTQFSSLQGLIHDAKHIGLIYEVLDLDGMSHSFQKKMIKHVEKKWRNVLFSVQRKQKHPETFNADEKKVFELFITVNEPNKFMAATHRKRMRFQLGQKDRFLSGLRESGRYLPYMEEVFKREGLPVELTRLPFVESSFNIHARSKVGASGIWQFMRSTGRLYLKINPVIDERNDPILATHAAAKLLKGNYESLGSWPLAVTAYNHGRQGMLRAVEKLGTEDLEEVVESYRSRSFGFASSNFFTELLAAVEVERNAEKYFGKTQRSVPLNFAEVKLPDYVEIKQLCKFMSLNLDQVRDLNPGLTEVVYEGRKLIPAGYVLRLPHPGDIEKDRAARIFLAGYDQIPALFKLKQQRGGVIYDRSHRKKRRPTQSD